MKFEADADEPKAGLATGVSDHLTKAVKLDQIPEVIVEPIFPTYHHKQSAIRKPTKNRPNSLLQRVCRPRIDALINLYVPFTIPYVPTI